MLCKEYVFTHQGIKTRLTAVAEGVIRITRTLGENFCESESPAVVLHQAQAAMVSEMENKTVFCAGQVQVHICRGVMTFTDDKGRVLLRENPGKPCILQKKPVMLNRFDPQGELMEERSIDGERAYAKPAETYLDRMGCQARQQFVFDDDEALYGLGSHEEGYGNLRGRCRVLYQQNMKAVVPVLVSTKGWGMLFDMGCMMAFHDDAEGSYLWADCTDELNWYFFYGDGTYAAAMGQYRLLTGATPMLPRYALGFVQSKERYVDAEEILSVAKEYRRRNIPLDVMVLDWQSWPQNQWGWKCFDRTRFPDPAALTDELHRMDVKLMISIWPSMQGNENQDRKDMLAKGCMLGNRLIYNAFDPAARALYWQQARDGLFRYGVDAWWCDCTEPFESDWRDAVKPEPLARAAMNTNEAKTYLDPTKISLYSLHHSQGIWEGQRAETRDKRVCNLTRSSWAGQHRYATVTWSGDVSANWETLRRHVPEGMNFCATGEGYWSTDIGAFFPSRADVWFIDGDYDQGMDDLGYRELFVRWAQYAAFLPMMRAHGTLTPREIWRLGEEGTPFYDAMASAIRLRYRLVPWLYTLMNRLACEGVPMLQHPALVFPQDRTLRRIDDQMMLGDALLIKPVTRPMYYLPQSEKIDGADKTETVYLPAGHDWYDWYTGQVYAGGQRVSVSAELEKIPLFVRSGAILPLGSDAHATCAQADQPLEVLVCPGENGTLMFYDDAGDTYGYENGESAIILLSWDDAARRLTIGKRQGSYAGIPQTRTLLVHTPGQKPVEVAYAGEEAAVQL